MAVLDWDLATTPLAAVDVETTGVNPNLDRIVEISVVRKNPQSTCPEIAFDSLINPRRPIQLREVHEITQQMVSDAPTFDEVAPLIIEAISGAVLVSHNASFDLAFLRFEFEQLNIKLDVPHLCTMRLRPFLGIGPRASLEELCRHHGIALAHSAHIASTDATAAMLIMMSMRKWIIEKLGIKTFGDIIGAGGGAEAHAFLRSFERSPLNAAVASGLRRGRGPKSRTQRAALQAFGTGTHVEVRREDYLQVLIDSISDFDVNEVELEYLKRVQAESGLSTSQICAAHAKVFAWMLQVFAQDEVVHAGERERLSRFAAVLDDLGWAPGSPKLAE